jgi:hypothetical protein
MGANRGPALHASNTMRKGERKCCKLLNNKASLQGNGAHLERKLLLFPHNFDARLAWIMLRVGRVARANFPQKRLLRDRGYSECCAYSADRSVIRGTEQA